MNSQPRKPSVLPGRVTGGVTSVVYADPLLLRLHSPILRCAVRPRVLRTDGRRDLVFGDADGLIFCRQRPGSIQGMTSPLSVERRACRSWGLPDRDDETSPQTGVVAAVIFLIDVCGQIGLQDDRTKTLTDQSADGDLALLLVTRDGRIEVRGPEGDQPELPLTELPAGRQIDIQEVRIAPVQCKGRWARRQLRTSGNVIEVSAPDHIRGQVQAIAGITEGEPLIERGRTPCDFTINAQIGTQQVAESPVVS
jgi:hypothetical protein